MGAGIVAFYICLGCEILVFRVNNYRLHSLDMERENRLIMISMFWQDFNIIPIINGKVSVVEGIILFVCFYPREFEQKL